MDTRGRGRDGPKFKQHKGPMNDGQTFGQIGRKQLKKKEKKHGSIEQPQLCNARQSRGIPCIDPDDKEFKDHEESAKKIGSADGICNALKSFQSARTRHIS